MEKIEINSVLTTAFYNKKDLKKYISGLLDDKTVVGIDLSIERTEIEDSRSTGSVTIYNLQEYKDLTVDIVE